MVSAAVLAAGLSTRMGGRPKGLLALDSRDTFVTRIVRTFIEAGISDVVVVLGHEAERVRAVVEASGLFARCVLNPRYQSGQLSSTITAIDAIDRSDVGGLLLALVDAPLFDHSTVRALVERFEQTHAPVIRACRGSDHGHPVLLGRALFDLIRQADPATGAKPIVRAHASSAGDVVVGDPGAFVDVDTPEDYERLLEFVRTRSM